MADEKRLIGEVKRDGTLIYELTMVDSPHGRQVEANRWEAGVASYMRLLTEAEREQIAERIRVSVNSYGPMRGALESVCRLMKSACDTDDRLRFQGLATQALRDAEAGLRAAEGHG